MIYQEKPTYSKTCDSCINGGFLFSSLSNFISSISILFDFTGDYSYDSETSFMHVFSFYLKI